METGDYSLRKRKYSLLRAVGNKFFQFVVFLFLNDWIGHFAAADVEDLGVCFLNRRR